MDRSMRLVVIFTCSVGALWGCQTDDKPRDDTDPALDKIVNDWCDAKADDDMLDMRDAVSALMAYDHLSQDSATNVLDAFPCG